jgi:hypothetical protein
MGKPKVKIGINNKKSPIWRETKSLVIEFNEFGIEGEHLQSG